MSMTRSRAHSPDFWTFSSEIMLLELKGILESGCINWDGRNSGVYDHAQHFFDLAVHGNDYGKASDEKREAHCTLFAFLCQLPQFKKTKTEESINKVIVELSTLNKTLRNNRKLDEAELQKMNLLNAVYQELVRQGYEQRRKDRGPGCF